MTYMILTPAEAFRRSLAMEDISGEEWNKIMARREECERALRELWSLRRRALNRAFTYRAIRALCAEIKGLEHRYKRDLL